jgi:hypothetical protein
MDYENNSRSMPISDLDLAMKNTNPEWGSGEVNQELRNRLKRYYVQKTEDGQEKIIEKKLWDLLNIYSRDLRLANLSSFDNELNVCRYMLDLSSDMIQADMNRGFIACITRVATITESSQSKSGFLRRMMNTLIQENKNQNIEPPKKSFFGGGNKETNY